MAASPAFVFRMHLVRVLQELADVLPDRVIQVFDAHLAVVTHFLPTEATPILARATVVGMNDLGPAGQPVTCPQAIQGIATPRADQQALQQPPRPPSRLAVP